MPQEPKYDPVRATRGQKLLDLYFNNLNATPHYDVLIPEAIGDLLHTARLLGFNLNTLLRDVDRPRPTLSERNEDRDE